MELFDLYNADRLPTGKTMLRGTATPEGCYRLVIHVCIFNSHGELLIQQRQPSKASWGGKWDLTVGGCVISGESSRMGAHREILEELGLDIDLAGMAPALSVTFPGGFDDYYILKMEPNISQLRFQPEEVAAARWASLEEILTMVDSGDFLPYHKSFLAFLFFQQQFPGVLAAK